MAKGDGQIISRGSGVWEVRVPAGLDPITKKYRTIYRTVRGTKAEARKVRDKIRTELESGLKANADKMTFSEFAAEWLQSRKDAGKVKERTIKGNEQEIRELSKFIGEVPLKNIDARLVEQTYSNLKKTRGCGNTRLHGYHVTLKAILQKAVDYDLILRNPCNRVDAPKIDSVERKSLTSREAARLLAELNKSEAEALEQLSVKEARQAAWGVAEGRSFMTGIKEITGVLAVRIGLATGMRLGEVLRLTWELADLKQGTLTVKDAKTAAGNRSVAIDSTTCEHLKAWKILQADLLSAIDIEQTDGTPVLCSGTGNALNNANFEHWWNIWRKAHGFDGLRFHELRHTQATQLLHNGVDVKTVQARLGHADASLTLNWYAHALPENDRKAADLLGNVFANTPTECKIVEVRTA